ncbi:MAG: ABC transporter ATP-binding protein [Oscillospiraceae bacterium]|jgi:branched-chain amino acid transport system ATP-binding protein
MKNILEIEGITVKYGKSVAINNVNIKIPEGGVVTLVGANGAGKSTTLKSLLGIVPISAGCIRYMGEDLAGMPIQERVRKGLVLVPEGRHLFPYLSVFKNLQLGATQRTDKENIERDFEYVFNLFPKLKDRRKQKAGTLSGGEQQMVAIARGLMAKPKLLCLDEPSLGLAPAVIEDIGRTIHDINKNLGISIFLVEQNVRLAFGVADYCYAMSVGEIIAEGITEEFQNSGAVRKAYFGG